MQINSINSYNYNNNYKKNNPSFEKMIKVSNVVLDNQEMIKDKQFYLMIDRAVKFLKKVENQSVDFVKNFWKSADSFDTKTLQRTSNFMVTSQDARCLTRASHDIAYKGGDKTEYQKMQNRLINDFTKRLKKDGIEQEVYIKAHSAKGKKIIIDEVGFKNIGGKVPVTTSNIVNPAKFDINGQGLLDF